jgi:hypothetical protein
MMADFQRRLKLAEINDQIKQEHQPVVSTGQAGAVVTTGLEKDGFKGDSGSSDDVLTVALGKERKRDKKKKQKGITAEPSDGQKRKRVSFSMDKNMTRGKCKLTNPRQSSTSTRR